MQKIKEVWGKTKLPLFIILMMLGTWGWTTFAFLFPPMYQENQKVWQDHLERVSPSSVEEKSETEGVDNNNGAMVQRDAVREREDKISPPSSVEEIIYEVAKQKQFSNPEILIRIARAESGMRVCAKNPTSSARGIFQILDMHGLTIEERCNPRIATAWAIDHFRDGHPWDSSKAKWDI